MRRAASGRADLAESLGRARAKRWEGRAWTRQQIALLGTMPDEGLAALTGRSESAVRVKRSKLGIPTYRDRRRRGLSRKAQLGQTPDRRLTPACRVSQGQLVSPKTKKPQEIWGILRS
jgi:hypothetical protein